MALAAEKIQWISPEEYIEGELHSEVRHEYIFGDVRAMAGASERHNVISGNVFAALREHFRGKKCRAFINDMKVRLIRADRSVFYYPDVLVACRNDEEDSPYFRDHPEVIFEVLSPETARTDLHEKYFAYTSIPSLHTYVVVSQDVMKLEVFRRAVPRWSCETLEKPDAVLSLPEIGFRMTAAEVYEDAAPLVH